MRHELHLALNQRGELFQ